MVFVCSECGERADQPGLCPRDGSPRQDATDEPLLGAEIGPYRIAQLLGVGGMGRVFKAVNASIGSRVAIKVLSRDCADNAELVERFFSEARAVNLIRHENIVNVLDLDQLPDRRPYIVMEYLDGLPLSSVMEQRGRLPLGSLARMTGETLSALSAAHSKSIVHRDLKPDNIFISPQGRAKVLDFGIAKLLPEQSGRSGPTQDGSLMGTPHYMAPEQALAQRVDARADIYAIGVILFEGATGQKPFESESLFDLLRQHIEKAPPSPRSLRPDLPPAYEQLILRCLAKNPSDRFPTARDLHNALVAATATLPPHAWGPIGTAEDQARPGMAALFTPSSGGYSGDATTPDRPGLGGGTAPGYGFGATQAAPSDHARQRDTTGPTGALYGGATAPGYGDQSRPGPTDAPPPHASMQPTPAGHGQMLPKRPPPSGGSKAAIWIALGAVAIAGGVAAVLLAGNNDSGGETQPASPTTAEAPTAPTNTVAGTQTDGGTATPPVVGANGGQLHIGNNVYVGGQKLPTMGGPDAHTSWGYKKGTSGHGLKIPGDVKKFDSFAYLEKATALARAHFPDAVLTRFHAKGVGEDGLSDLTLNSSMDITYIFQSKKHGERPADLPVGVEHQATCRFFVNISNQIGMNYYPVPNQTCDEDYIGPPKCSLKEVWKRAKKKGAPGGNVVAEIGYWPDKGKGRYYFTIGGKHSQFFEDNCL